MLLPGFTAGASLAKATEAFSGGTSRNSARFSVQLQQANRLAVKAGRLGSVSAGLSGCQDLDHVPVCYSPNPTRPGRCCDTTHEKICNGRRVAICTFTDCSGFPDTASL